jgi:hypothetical protein
MNHGIEMKSVQSQVCANLFLFIFCEIEPEEHLDIAFVWHLFEHLQNESRSLFPQQLFELIRRGVREKQGFFLFSQSFLARGTPEVINDQISGHAAHEARKLLRFSNISSPDPFKYEAKCLLVEIGSGGGLPEFPAKKDSDAVMVAFDQFGLGSPVARHNTADETGLGADIIYS